MTMLTRLLTPLLIALMVLTSASLAVARAAPDAAGQMVLCTGSGPVVIQFDENGDPIGTPHYCPDCAMTLLEAVVGNTSSAARAFGVGDVVFEAASALTFTGQARCAQARDPPLV